ncbi:MAG: hypothetical protein ACR2MB_00065 [Acidimicrobiales bacterium]
MSIASSVAGRLAGMLVGPLGAKLKDEALGTDAARAVERVCSEAVDEVVRALSTVRTDSDVVHVVSLLDEALASRGAANLPLAESLVEGRGLEAWQASFDVLGFDAETLPLDFEAFVRELSVVLPAKLRAEAAGHNSPLFERVAMSDLDWMRCNAADLRAAIERTVVAPAVPLSAELERALDASFERCRDTDTRY